MNVLSPAALAAVLALSSAPLMASTAPVCVPLKPEVQHPDCAPQGLDALFSKLAPMPGSSAPDSMTPLFDAPLTPPDAALLQPPVWTTEGHDAAALPGHKPEGRS